MVAHSKLTVVLISFVQTLLDQEHTKAVLLDIYNNPIEIELESFLEELHHVTLKQQTNTAE